MNKTTLFLFLSALLLLFACEEDPVDPVDPIPPIDVDRIRYEAILDDTINAYMAAERIPGLAVGVIRDSKIDWLKGYGFANLAQQEAVDKNTRFMVGDPAQVVIGVAFMQLVEQGKIGLDDNINAFLPFPLIDPYFPQAKLTPRMLLAHTSGIKDRSQVLDAYYSTGDATVELGDFLESYLSMEGTDYSFLNFGAEKPGREYNYSRVGISLAAYLIEQIEGISFEQYCRVHVFAELGVFNTSWLLTGFQTNQLAVPYKRVGSNLEPQAFYGYPFYPSGTLKISVEHLSRFWLSMIEAGVYGPQQLIKPTTLEGMYEVQYPDASTSQAVTWQYRDLEGRNLLGLSGSDLGLSTRMMFDVDTQRGVILLSNGNGYDEALDRILLRTFEAAETR